MGGGHSRLTSHIKGFGATHVARWSNSRKRAFTLAEVLITLGIIGVVAALTLPTLIANYRNQVYATQLKKSVSMLEQGFKKVLADEGVDNLSDTSLFSSIEGDEYGYLRDLSTDDGKKFVEGMKKYFKIIEAGKGDNHHYDDLTTVRNWDFGNCLITFADGSQIGSCNFQKIASKSSNIATTFQGTFYIDVNGDKRPNVLGKDIFYFYLAGDGRLVPLYSKEFSDFHGMSGLYWRNGSGCGEPGKKIAKDSKVQGEGCAARIIENGWKIDYL